MSISKFINFLALIFILVACKKQELPAPEYLLERDNKKPGTIISRIKLYPTKDTSIEDLDLTPNILYSTRGLPDYSSDSIYGYINCVRPGLGKNVTTNQGSIYLSDTIPLKYINTELVNNPRGFKLYNNENNPSLIVCEFIYKKKRYKVYSSIGFSNCIIDSSVFKIGYSNGYLRYNIMFDGPPLNTDLIKTCNGDHVPIVEATITLDACGSVANYNGKPNTFKLSYTNYEYFKIDGKRFIIDKHVLMYLYTYP